MFRGTINQKTFSEYSMAQKQFIPNRVLQPTLESITQDVSQLDRATLLKLQAIIEQLLEQVSLEAGVPQSQPQQASCIEAELDSKPLTLRVGSASFGIPHDTPLLPPAFPLTIAALVHNFGTRDAPPLTALPKHLLPIVELLALPQVIA